MPDISELKKSSFVTKSDINPNGSLFTVTGCEQVNTAKEGAMPEMKWALNLQEVEKPFVLNSTNGQIIAQFTGSTRMEVWGEARAKIVLYWDPNVSFAGKLTGGIRVRAPRIPAATPARPLPAPATPAPAAAAPNTFGNGPGGPDEDVPF